MDLFLITDSLLEKQITMKQWIRFGGIFDHYPIFLEYRQRTKKPTNPFKFNSTWFEGDNFIFLVKENWIPFQQDCPQSTAFQFAENLKRIKEVVKPRASQKRKNEEKELKEIELELHRFSKEGGRVEGVCYSRVKINILLLQKRRNKLLKEKEDSWRLKSRAIWLESGDENTNFFQAFAKGRRSVNTIW